MIQIMGAGVYKYSKDRSVQWKLLLLSLFGCIHSSKQFHRLSEVIHRDYEVILIFRIDKWQGY
jgi:hypothetical protein